MEKYNDLKLVSENREHQRAYYVPFQSPESAFEDKNSNSDRYILLNGTWDFEYLPTPLDVPDDISEVSYSTDPIVILQLIGVGVLLTLVSSLSAVLFIMRYEPLKILTNRD